MEKEDDGSNRLLKRKQYEQKLRRLQAELLQASGLGQPRRPPGVRGLRGP